MPIQAALAQEEQRTRAELEKLQVNPTYRSCVHRYYSYQQRGLYLDPIQRYHQLFVPAQVLILSSEEFFANTPSVLQTVFAFLGVDAGWQLAHLEPKNAGTNKDQVPDAVRQSLRAYFAPHNQRLYQYLGRDFHWD